MLIRQAQSFDAHTLSELIFSSATNILSLMFDVNEELNTLDFLKNALTKQDGQFGYGNHWVLEKNDQVVAVSSAWHNELSAAFHSATLQSISHYYGVAHALTIIQRCHVLQNIFPAPQKNELCIGHFAVLSLYRRQGLGSHLIAHMRKLALHENKNALTLDVEMANQSAQVFYQRLGFQVAGRKVTSQQLNGVEIGPYCHMRLLL